ncbi:MAG: PD40 domain-containing protein [Bacteroidetes bacterium]|nr:PD40 domain-containing protein [Bacteroidota bacterium]
MYLILPQIYQNIIIINHFLISTSFLIVAVSGCKQGAKQEKPVEEEIAVIDTITYPQEKHLKNLHQLTFGGDNAEAYFSFDSKMIVFQRRDNKDVPCDQIYYGTIPTDNSRFEYKLLSTGKGRTTCSYFLPGNDKVIFASTHAKVDTCIADPDRSKGYLWGVYPSYEIYVADLNGNIVQQLTDNDFYDAEAVVSPKGDKILFTSNRSGDLELWTMNLDGTDLKQITNELGYDGGAFFSPDGNRIVFRASRPKTQEEITTYKTLLKEHFVKPTAMELFTCMADGSDLRQITTLGGANWAPFFHPSGNKIIFSSNHTTKRVPFNLFMINLDGTGLEQITFDTVFDSFPMFSYDGKKLIFASNRNSGGTRDTNLFIADWVE